MLTAVCNMPFHTICSAKKLWTLPSVLLPTCQAAIGKLFSCESIVMSFFFITPDKASLPSLAVHTHS